MNRISVLIKETSQRFPDYSTMRGHHKKLVIHSPEEGPRPPVLAHTLILNFEPPALWQVNFCCLCYPVYGILLQQPKWTKTHQGKNFLCVYQGLLNAKILSLLVTLVYVLPAIESVRNSPLFLHNILTAYHVLGTFLSIWGTSASKRDRDL